MITAVIFGDPQAMFFQKDSASNLILALKKNAPRKPIDFAVLIRVKVAYKHLKSKPYARNHARNPTIACLLAAITDALVPAGWLADDALVDQLVAEKCRVGDPYLEVTMKERQ